MNRDWTNLEVVVPEDLADPVANFCHEHEAQGVVFGEPLGGTVNVVAYYARTKPQRFARRSSRIWLN